MGGITISLTIDPMIIAIIFAYLLVLLTSGKLVKYSLKAAMKKEEFDEISDEAWGAGTIIGKCENFLIVTFMLLGGLTALGLIFAAKGLIRKGENGDGKNPSYYLVGTLVNFTYSVFIGGMLLFILDTI